MPRPSTPRTFVPRPGTRHLRRAIRLTCSGVVAAAALTAQAPAPAFVSADALQQLAWRALGPANPMGRMTDIAVPRQDSSTWFIGTAGGGLWRTQNAGTTFTCVLDSIGCVSIGDVAVAPSDPAIVWVGTGEENARNSVQWGDGVYRSLDGGETFEHMGLRETFQIGHIEIHPEDPDTVYVAALGELWGDNPERGVYRTRDGGRSWQRVLHFNDRTGCVDVRIHPQDPDTVFACLYERRRDRFDGNDPSVRFGEYSGIYKSIDGGDNWRQLIDGLPTCTWGRSGIDLLQSSPDTMFAIVETERSGWQSGTYKDARPGDEGATVPRPPRGTAVLGVGSEGDDGDDDRVGAILTTTSEDGPAAQAGLQVGDRITAIDDEPVRSYADLLEIVRDSRAGQKLAIVYARDDDIRTVDVTLGSRPSPMARAAQRPNGPFSGRLFGQVANKQQFQGEQGFETGGVFRSDDRGESWRRINSLTERPFYYSVIRVDPQSAERVYCVGTSLWASTDGGETFAAIHRDIHVDFHAVWIDPTDGSHLIALCDGGVNESMDGGTSWQVHRGFCAAQYYDCAVNNDVPYNVIGGLQDNGTWVVPSRTRYREGITTHDCFKIYGGDGFGAQVDPHEPHVVFATSQNGNCGIVDTRTGATTRLQRERLPDGSQARCNWDAPFVLSPHNPLVVYHAGSHLFRGDRYGHLDHRDSRPDQGPIQNERGVRMRLMSPFLGASSDGTATALAESPLVPGLLYVGTDDGALWRRDPDDDDLGGSWTRIDTNLPVFAPLYVADLLPSQFATDRLYVVLDGHRSNDFESHVFVSDDRGATFRDLGFTLPLREPCHCVAEDPRNEDLLFLGTEFGCWTSLDRGANWLRLRHGMPNVSVRELVIQDRDSDLVAATHGRGLFVLDIEALRRLDRATAATDVHLFAVEPATLWRLAGRELQGHKEFAADNPPYGVTFYVWHRTAPEKAVVLTIHDATQQQIAEVTGKAVAGLQAIQWDARVGGRALATPGSYAVRIRGVDDVPAQPFLLRSDPYTTSTRARAQHRGDAR